MHLARLVRSVWINQEIRGLLPGGPADYKAPVPHCPRSAGRQENLLPIISGLDLPVENR
jgi:hypothetical protein